MIRRLTTSVAPDSLLSEIRALLDDAFAGEFSDEDWQHTLGGWHVVVEVGGAVVSHAAVVARVLHLASPPALEAKSSPPALEAKSSPPALEASSSRPVRAGYVEGVATAPGRRRQGLGSQVMLEVADVVRDGFEVGALSTGLPDFYGRLGWEVWRGPTFVRHGSQLIRTEEEDGGVMVLRFGPTAEVDLDGTISCESRPGDDW